VIGRHLRLAASCCTGQIDVCVCRYIDDVYGRYIDVGSPDLPRIGARNGHLQTGEPSHAACFRTAERRRRRPGGDGLDGDAGAAGDGAGDAAEAAARRMLARLVDAERADCRWPYRRAIRVGGGLEIAIVRSTEIAGLLDAGERKAHEHRPHSAASPDEARWRCPARLRRREAACPRRRAGDCHDGCSLSHRMRAASHAPALRAMPARTRQPHRRARPAKVAEWRSSDDRAAARHPPSAAAPPPPSRAAANGARTAVAARIALVSPLPCRYVPRRCLPVSPPCLHRPQYVLLPRRRTLPAAGSPLAILRRPPRPLHRSRYPPSQPDPQQQHTAPSSFATQPPPQLLPPYHHFNYPPQ